MRTLSAGEAQRRKKAMKLIYFEGCPKIQKTKELLKGANITSYEEVSQDDLPEGHELKNYSSPTFLKGEKILFGSKSKGGGCSVQFPSVEELKNRLG